MKETHRGPKHTISHDGCTTNLSVTHLLGGVFDQLQCSTLWSHGLLPDNVVVSEPVGEMLVLHGHIIKTCYEVK